jgi:hypothetical protein
MRLLYAAVAPFLLGKVALGCNTVSPDECWPNTSGGFGGGTIPIGAGVGATSSGDFDSPPPKAGPPNPCVASAPPSSPGDGAEALDAWITCPGLDALGCMMKCAEAGAACTGHRSHPYKPEVGLGDLYRCKNGAPTHTCSYYFPNGDECIYFSPFGMIPWCVYIGGKP